MGIFRNMYLNENDNNDEFTLKDFEELIDSVFEEDLDLFFSFLTSYVNAINDLSDEEEFEVDLENIEFDFDDDEDDYDIDDIEIDDLIDYENITKEDILEYIKEIGNYGMLYYLIVQILNDIYPQEDSEDDINEKLDIMSGGKRGMGKFRGLTNLIIRNKNKKKDSGTGATTTKRTIQQMRNASKRIPKSVKFLKALKHRRWKNKNRSALKFQNMIKKRRLKSKISTSAQRLGFPKKKIKAKRKK